MRHTVRLATIAVATVTLLLPLGAQTRQGVMGDLLRDVGEVEKKILGLAKAMPDPAWAWRPSAAVRSTQEVLLHVAADNYFIPVLGGVEAPKETGITKEYNTAVAFEKKTMNRDAVVAEVQKSFAFLKKAMESTPDAKLDTPLDIFGQKGSTRSLWVSATTHLHEHLGQLIVHARSNNVVPPWSK